MKTPEEILNEVAAENMINIQQMVTTKQLAIIAMRRYAKEYHDSEVKKLNIPAVIKSVCPHCGSESDNIAEPRKYKCGNCNRLFYEQTVL